MNINLKMHMGIHPEGIRITIQDKASLIQIMRIVINKDDAMRLLSNYGDVNAIAEVSGLRYVGKKKVTKDFSFELPENVDNSTEDIAKYAESICPEGWFISTYFGSQTSRTYRDGKVIMRTHLFRYESKGCEDQEGKR